MNEWVKSLSQKGEEEKKKERMTLPKRHLKCTGMLRAYAMATLRAGEKKDCSFFVHVRAPLSSRNCYRLRSIGTRRHGNGRTF